MLNLQVNKAIKKELLRKQLFFEISALNASGGNAFDQRLLEDQEDDRGRHNGQGRHGQRGTDIRTRGRIVEQLQRQRDGTHVGAVYVQQGGEVVVPAPDEGEDGGGD